MASYVTPKKNTQFICYIGLVDQSNTKLLKANPTIATGDFKVSIDGGAFNNLGTLPTVTPASGTGVKITLSTSEMNGDNIVVTCIDAAGAEWCDLLISIQTTAGQIDEIVLVDTVTTLTNNTPTAGTITTVGTTTNLTNNTPTAGTITTLTQLTNVIPDSVPADGTRPSIQQALYMLTQFMTERAVSGLTMTVNKVDGTTALMTFTLNDAVAPTTITRAT